MSLIMALSVISTIRFDGSKPLSESNTRSAVDAGLHHVPGRQVDADRGVVRHQSRLLPPEDLAAGLGQHETVDRSHEPGLLHELYERGRTKEARVGCSQRTRASKPMIARESRSTMG